MSKRIFKSIILSLALMVISLGSANAQTYIRTNALYWLGLLPNVGVETRLGNHFTFEGEVNASFWESINDRPYVGSQFIIGARYYPKQAFKGFYVGGDYGFDLYKVSKWDHSPTDVQHGLGYYLGITLGYQMKISPRWNMDFYAGGGWHLGKYYGINLNTNDFYVRWNASGEWIPYKLGVAFAYRLTSDKKMRRNRVCENL